MHVGASMPIQLTADDIRLLARAKLERLSCELRNNIGILSMPISVLRNLVRAHQQELQQIQDLLDGVPQGLE